MNLAFESVDWSPARDKLVGCISSNVLRTPQFRAHDGCHESSCCSSSFVYLSMAAHNRLIFSAHLTATSSWACVPVSVNILSALAICVMHLIDEDE